MLFDGTKGFSNDLRLGGGAFGDVYLCDVGSEKVAVKRLKLVTPDGADASRMFAQEISSLTSVQHPHILTLLGYSTTGPALCLVYLFMPKGSLQDRLEAVVSREKYQRRCRVKRFNSAVKKNFLLLDWFRPFLRLEDQNTSYFQ